MKQNLTWTTLPAGIDAGANTLKVSVRLSPRLDPQSAQPATLGSFKDFKAWAGQAITFALQIGPDGGNPQANRWPLTCAKDPRDAALWTALFPETTPVRMRDEKFPERRIRSFPIRGVLSYLKECYRETGLTYPESLPPTSWLGGARDEQAGLLQEIQGLANEWSSSSGRARLMKNLDGLFQGMKYVKAEDGRRSPMMDFLQALVFHKAAPGPLKSPKLNTPDFHELVSIAEEYDQIMRRLGLVFDLECSLTPALRQHLQGLPPASRWIRIHPVWSAVLASTPKLPRTAFVLNLAKAVFMTAPSAGMTDDLLDLGDSAYDLVQVDVDGAAIKLTGLMQNLLRMQGATPTEILPEDAGLPSLRSAGISLVRTGRAEALSKKMDTGKEWETKSDDELLFRAEDLIKGYRIDILDEKIGVWRSLCQRREAYFTRTAPHTPLLPSGEAEAEGTVSPAVTSKPGDPNQDIYAHESLFHWDGWSLVARRPGKAIRAGDSTDTGAPETDGKTGLQVEVQPLAKSLPRLRFGRSYRLRARVVDIAGNSRSPQENESDPTGSSSPMTYRRFEPVASPAITRMQAYIEGESMDRLVIRDSAHSGEVTESCQRIVAPPRSSIQNAELHGMLDTPAPSEESWYTILNERHKLDTCWPELQTKVPDDIPYLPDPLAIGVLVRDLPGIVSEIPIDWGSSKSWPSASPFVIRVVSGSGSATWNTAERILSVALPPAALVTIRLSCHLSGLEVLDQLGMLAWLADGTADWRMDILKDMAVQGKHWMLTPSRTLTLVHAVKRPLAPPVIENFQVTRALGQTSATLSGKIGIDGASTGKVEITAAWRDRIDDPTKPGSGDDWRPADPLAVRTGHVCDLVNGSRDCQKMECGGMRHDLGDTRYRKVSYRPKATSSFQEYYPQRKGQDFTLAGQGVVVDVLNTARPAAPMIEYVVPVFGWERSERPKGLASRRVGGGVRVYLRRPWFSSGDGELLGVVIGHGPIKASESVQVPDNLANLVTRWGFDPIWIAHPPNQLPTVADFPLAIAKASGVTIEETVSRPIDPHSWWLSVAGHAVAFDTERQLWYADIAMDTGPAYFPFVRLALARYQPQSVQGAELSRVVVADFIQTAPDRLVWISDMPDNPLAVQISVAGPAPRNSQIANITPTVMAVRVEFFHPNEESGNWLPAGEGWLVLVRTQLTLAESVWNNTVVLPAPRASRRFRLVIGELEVLKADSSDLPEISISDYLSSSRVGVRPVYMDCVEI